MTTIMWKPFSTAPKDRPIYAFSKVHGLQLIRWRVAPPRTMQKDGWKMCDNDPDTIVSYASIYKWPDHTHWAEVEEIEPHD